MTETEIVRETIEFYGVNPSERRALTGIIALDGNEVCAYETRDGRRCAVGRCLKSLPGGNLQCDDPDIWPLVARRLKKRYRGHDKGFWRALQILHDYQQYWDSDGLSSIGKKYVVENFGASALPESEAA